MRPWVLAVVIVLAGTVGAREKNVPPAKPAAAPPRGIVVTRAGEGARADARLAGRLVGWTRIRGMEGRKEIVLLLEVSPKSAAEAPAAACSVSEGSAPGEDPRRLVRLDPRGAGAIVGLRDDLPPDTEGLGALDMDGDGRDEIVLFRPGRVEAIAPGSDGGFRGERVTLVDDPEVGAGATGRGLGPANDPGGARLRLPVVGALRAWAPDPARSLWRTISDAPTPFRADPGAERLVLVGPRILSCGNDASGRARFVTEAEAVGRDRLRARLLDPEAAPDARSQTCWAKLPAPERALEQSCLTLDGAPHLAVTTTSSEKLSLLGEKRLRLYPLVPDRSRTGAAPRFAVTTGLNLWQPTTPTLADVNGDGRPDLVLPYWKGLKGSSAVLEVYPGRAAEGFDPAPRRTEIGVDDGEKNWIGWGDDSDGDGRADLILFAGKEVLLFPGTASSDARRLVASKPTARLPWPEDAPDIGFVWSGIDGRGGATGGVAFGTLGVPAVSDLDGDGRVEIILAGNDAEGGRVIVFSFPPAR